MQNIKRLLALIAATCVGAAALTPGYAQQQQHHSNPLCDDYIRIKLESYLDTAATVNMDEYLAYKQELVAYCDKMIRCGESTEGSASPGSATQGDPNGKAGGLRSYKLDLY